MNMSFMNATDFEERGERTLYASPVCEIIAAIDIIATSYALPVMPLGGEDETNV